MYMKSLSEIVMKPLKESILASSVAESILASSVAESILDKDFDFEFIEEKIIDAIQKYTSVVPNKFVVAPLKGHRPYRMITSFDDLKKMLDFIGIKYKEVDTSRNVVYSSDLVLDMGVEFETVDPWNGETYEKNRYLISRRMGGKLPFEWGCLNLETAAGFNMTVGHSAGFGLINDSNKLKIDYSGNKDYTRKFYQCGMNKNTQKTLVDVLISIYKAQNENT